MAKKKKKAAKKAVARRPMKKAAAKKAVAKKAAPRKNTSAARAKSAVSTVKKATPGHLSVAAGITANDAAASIKWYCDVLGFTLAEKWEIEGVFRGGSVRSGNVQINIGQDDWKSGRDRIKGQGVRVYVQTAVDIDKYANAIKSRGGVLEQEPADHWGTRTFSIADPDGFKFTFMSPRNS